MSCACRDALRLTYGEKSKLSQVLRVIFRRVSATKMCTHPDTLIISKQVASAGRSSAIDHHRASVLGVQAARHKLTASTWTSIDCVALRSNERHCGFKGKVPLVLLVQYDAPESAMLPTCSSPAVLPVSKQMVARLSCVQIALVSRECRHVLGQC